MKNILIYEIQKKRKEKRKEVPASIDANQHNKRNIIKQTVWAIRQIGIDIEIFVDVIRIVCCAIVAVSFLLCHMPLHFNIKIISSKNSCDFDVVVVLLEKMPHDSSELESISYVRDPLSICFHF